MLYPIELLGQMTVARPKAWRRTASMLTAKVGFVMSSVGFLRVGDSSAGRRLLRPVKPDMRGIVQNALPQNASIANCNQKAPQNKLKLLIFL